MKAGAGEVVSYSCVPKMTQKGAHFFKFMMHHPSEEFEVTPMPTYKGPKNVETRSPHREESHSFA